MTRSKMQEYCIQAVKERILGNIQRNLYDEIMESQGESLHTAKIFSLVVRHFAQYYINVNKLTARYLISEPEFIDMANIADHYGYTSQITDEYIDSLLQEFSWYANLASWHQGEGK